MRIAIVHHRSSGSARSRGVLEAVLARLNAFSPLSLDLYDSIESVPAVDDYDTIAVAGGDGSVNRSACTLRGSSTPLAIIPTGTANVLARHIGLKEDPDFLSWYILNGAFFPVKLAKAGNEFFLFSFSSGCDARVLNGTDLFLKSKFGELAVGVSVIKNLVFGMKNPSFVAFLEEFGSYEVRWIIVSRINNYAGIFPLRGPERGLADESFSVILLENASYLDLWRYLWAFWRGKLERCKGVTVVRSVSRFDLTGAMVNQCDGDVWFSPAGQSFTVEMSQEKVFLKVPSGYLHSPR